jgi:hypothetical protein
VLGHGARLYLRVKPGGGAADAASMLAIAPLLALAVAAGGTQNAASGVCPIKVDGVRGGQLTAGVTIDNAKSTAVAKSSCGQIAKVVRGLVAERAEMPMKVNGFRCTPTVTGPHPPAKVAWECVYRGGTPRTRVVADFAYRYAG